MLWEFLKKKRKEKKVPPRIRCKFCQDLCSCCLLRNALQILSDKQSRAPACAHIAVANSKKAPGGSAFMHVFILPTTYRQRTRRNLTTAPAPHLRPLRVTSDPRGDLGLAGDAGPSSCRRGRKHAGLSNAARSRVSRLDSTLRQARSCYPFNTSLITESE